MAGISIKQLEGTVTNEGLCIAFNQNKKDKKGTILLKTPEDRIISLSDADVDLQGVAEKPKKEIRLQFDKNTMIILNEDGITLKGKEIKIEGSSKVMVNQSEFKK